jgi:hypothetical protein
MWELAQLDENAKIKILVPYRQYRIIRNDRIEGYGSREPEIITTSPRQLPITMAHCPNRHLQINCAQKMLLVHTRWQYDYILKEPGTHDEIFLRRKMKGGKTVAPKEDKAIMANTERRLPGRIVWKLSLAGELYLE